MKKIFLFTSEKVYIFVKEKTMKTYGKIIVSLLIMLPFIGEDCMADELVRTNT